MKNNLKNQQGGFLELIVVLIITFLIMRYYGITFTGIFNWLRDLFLSVW
jgi:hypothetical protein